VRGRKREEETYDESARSRRIAGFGGEGLYGKLSNTINI
jgi:hypothetical protein